MKQNQIPEEAASWVVEIIKQFIKESPENTLKNTKNDKAWAEPLVGFSRGDDSIYDTFKADIGDYYWTPGEIFSKTFPDSSKTADKITVISWILPQTEATKSDNRKETFYPAERWARARIFGEETNVKLREHVVKTLQEAGYKAVAPMLSPMWERKDSERYVFASTWSERHVAHASGLGTFGLCDGLITPVGKAMRAGSVVVDLQIPPTERPYDDHQAYCLFFAKGICGKCIKRCPVDALSEAGHDKKKCVAHLRTKTTEHVKTQYGFDGYGCGLCQVGVPCESKIPMEKDLKD